MVSFVRLLFWILVQVCARPSYRWLGTVNAGPQRIYFANHQSHFDWLVIRYALPTDARDQVRPVVAAEYWGATRFKRFLTRSVFRTVPLTRMREDSAPVALEVPLRALAEGVSLILFPEGTRSASAGGEPGDFKSGLYHLARANPGVQLIPVWIEGTHRVMPKGKLVPRVVHCTATFGAPLQLEPTLDKAAFLARARCAVMALRPSGGPRPRSS